MKTKVALFAVVVAFTHVVTAQNFKTLDPLVSFGVNGDGLIKPNDGKAFITIGNKQRGFCYNPVTGNILLVDRANGSTSTSEPNVTGSIYVLDGTNGSELGSTFGSGLLNTNGMYGGDFADLAIGVADDGAVYVANLVNSGVTNTFKIYRWDSDSSAAPPVVAFSGDPGNGIAQRWGDTMDVRGAGTNTQIIIGARTFSSLLGTNAAVFTTFNGTNFSATLLKAEAGESFGDGIAFGAGNTFWAKTVGQPLRYFSFDTTNGTATVIRAYDASNFPGYTTLGPITVDPVRNLLAAQNVISLSDQVRLYDISNPNKFVLLDSKDFPINNAPPSAAAGFLDFGGTNLYTHNINNGIFALSVTAVDPPQPPALLSQPATLRVAVGRSASFSVEAIRASAYQWYFGATPIADATNAVLTLTNVQATDSGSYSVVVSNSAGTDTSSTATLTVVSTNLHYLRYLWSIAPGSRSYMTLDSNAQGQTPLQRSVAYNALSNHVYIINRTAATSGLSVNVVDATTGADLYTLKTTGITGGDIILLGIGCGDDGAIYAGNETTAANNATKPFKLYRWATADPNTLPTLVYQGEPADQGSPFRWGDTLTVRGSGTNTQVLIDDNSGNYATILRPTDATMTTFTNTESWFFRTYGSGSIGRSLQFGSGNVMWQKRKGLRLEKSGCDLPAPFGSNISNPIASYTNFASTIGAMGMDETRGIAAALNFGTSTLSPDTLDFFEISDLENPLLLAQYNFPVNHKPNGNFIGQVVIAGDKAFAINGNNGILAFSIEDGTPPAPYIVTQPENKTIAEGVSVALTVFTADTATYQWQKNGANIAGATSSAFAILNAQPGDAATYRVLVSNLAGTAISSNAVVTVRSTNDVYSLSPAWTLSPGSTNTFLTSTDGNGQSDNLQRGMAYNPATGHLLIASRASSSSVQGIYIIDSETGALLGTLNTNGINGGGTFILNKIDVADDGAIYAANFGSYPGTTNTIYRWQNETAALTIAFSGDPGLGTNQEWGRTLAVRGSGADTQILLGCRKTVASILTTADGLTFTPHVLQTDANADDYGFGIAFGQGNTFWGKSDSRALKQFSFDINAGTATTIQSFTSTELLNVSPIGYDSIRNLLGGISIVSGTDSLYLFDVSSTNSPVPVLASRTFPFDKNNVNFAGSVEFGADKVFALDTNNGLIAYRLNSPLLPLMNVTRTGATMTISWSANGYILESSDSLTSPNWNSVPFAPGTPNSATVNITSGINFYRLRK